VSEGNKVEDAGTWYKKVEKTVETNLKIDEEMEKENAEN